MKARVRFDEVQGPRIGLALGGGFARGIAHIGVLRVFERERLPIHSIAGVSAGSIVAAAFASGCTSQEIETAARGMRFSDVAEGIGEFLRRLLKTLVFERMSIPLAVIASDLNAGSPVVFKNRGDVVLPIRASCSYPGLYPPVRYMNHSLVDGMIAMDIPAAPLRRMGATHVISVALPAPSEPVDPQNMLSVVKRCFQIMTVRTGSQWRRHSNVVIEPDVQDVSWDSFESAQQIIEAGARAAEAVLPQILAWFPERGGEATEAA
jgi:NTE family protein